MQSATSSCASAIVSSRAASATVAATRPVPKPVALKKPQPQRRAAAAAHTQATVNGKKSKPRTKANAATRTTATSRKPQPHTHAKGLVNALASLTLGSGLPRLLDPVDEPGHWVPTAKFRKFKSFGGFTCGRRTCCHMWVSAHAARGYWQQCQRCEWRTQPEQMWVNEQRPRRRGEEREVQRPDQDEHDEGRCQRCTILGSSCWKKEARSRVRRH